MESKLDPGTSLERHMIRVPPASFKPSSGEVPASRLMTDSECADECRCHCGNLLARVVPGGVELKCRRCKRTFVVKVATVLEDGT